MDLVTTLWALTILFVLVLIFNIFFFRQMLKQEKNKQKELEAKHLDNIAHWKSYAVTCIKFQDGECDLSIPCDCCKHFTEPEKHE